MPRSLRCLPLVLSLLWPLLSQADEMADRRDIKGRVQSSFTVAHYAEIDALATQWRTGKTRLASGQWKLAQLYDGLSAQFVVGFKSDAYWNKLDQQIAAWHRLAPSSPTAQLAYSRMLLNRAWTARGEGYANSVSKDNMRRFNDFVTQARTALVASKASAASDPEWYKQMLEIGVLQGWSEQEYSALLNEALDHEPYYYDFYYTALSHYSPRWGGSVKAIDQLADLAVNRTRGQDGEGMYARLYWYASSLEFGNNVFRATKVSWPRMSKGIDAVLSTYSEAWNVNNFARFACLAGDAKQTAALIERIEGEPMQDVWSDGPPFDQCQALASKAAQ